MIACGSGSEGSLNWFLIIGRNALEAKGKNSKWNAS